jgi:hypothetical protein
MSEMGQNPNSPFGLLCLLPPAADIPLFSRRVAEPKLRRQVYFVLARATSAALIPSNASPSVTPSSMMRRSFWVIAMPVWLVVSCGGLATPSAMSRTREGVQAVEPAEIFGSPLGGRSQGNHGCSRRMPSLPLNIVGQLGDTIC